MGEGEYTMLDIVDSLKDKRDLRNISGTVVRDQNGMKINRKRPYILDLDTLPFPAYHLIRLEDYFSLYAEGFTDRPVWPYPGSERAVSVVTSRGCPFNCIFCSIHLHMGNVWRFHSIEYFIRHLSFLIQKYNIHHVHFEDDNLTLNPARFKKMLREFLNKEMHFTWDTPNGIRVDTLTKELLLDCKRSGCTYLIFGIESGNQRVLNDIIDKRLDLDGVSPVASWCKEIHLDTMAFFVIGFPGETKQEMRDTIDFALSLEKRFDVTPSLFIATPLPGTRLKELYLKEVSLKEELTPQELARMTSGAFLLGTDRVREDEIKTLIKKFYRGHKLIFAYNSLIFLIRNPRAFLRFIVKCIEEKNPHGFKEKVFNLLQFKNCLTRKFHSCISS